MLAVSTRASLEHELRTDPLTRGALWALLGAAAAGALLALAGLALLLAGDRRDDRGELADLEVQGFVPRSRGAMCAPVPFVTGLGFLGGAAIAAVLAAAVVDMVAVTASRAALDPPLLLSADWVLIAAAGPSSTRQSPRRSSC